MTSFYNFVHRSIAGAFLISSVLLAHAAKAQRDHYNLAKDSVAIGGYDPVAYFVNGEARKGSKTVQVEWDGVKWYFSSYQNREIFIQTPERFTPQFGGWCAFGVSENYKAPVDPEAWSVVNDKLYLNYNKKVRSLWQKDRERRIEQANSFWPGLRRN